MLNLTNHTFFNREIINSFTIQMNDLIYYMVECHLMFERLLPHVRSGRLHAVSIELIDDSGVHIVNIINGFDVISGNHLSTNLYKKLLFQLHHLDFSGKGKHSAGSDIAIADGIYKLLYNQVVMLDMLLETSLVLKADNILLGDCYASATGYKDIFKKIHVELLMSFVKDNLTLYQ